MLKKILAHPLTRGIDLDDPRTTFLRKEIIAQKPFLKKIYEDWYQKIVRNVPDGPGRVLELGSGAGFLDQSLPGLVTSEVFFTPQVRVVLDGLNPPIRTHSLKSIVMVDVLHHIPDARQFFHQAARCVRPGGNMVMVEPWVSWWSNIIYTRLHHEPFSPQAAQWEFSGTGPLSSANGALPWILFQRDRSRFEMEFPEWQIEQIRLDMPFVYLLSGGISLRNLMPGWSYNLVRWVEGALSGIMDRIAMFALVVLKRKE